MLAGGILAFFSFALPWENTYTGIYLANGFGGLITIVLMISLAIICTNLYLIYTKSNLNSLIITVALLLGMTGVYGCLVVLSRHDDSGVNLVSTAFLMSLVIIGATIYMLNRQSEWRSVPTLWILTSSCIGLCCYLVVFFGDSLDLVQNEVEIKSPQYGASLTAIGFIFAIVGSLCFPQTEKRTVTKDNSENETASTGNTEDE